MPSLRTCCAYCGKMDVDMHHVYVCSHSSGMVTKEFHFAIVNDLTGRRWDSYKSGVITGAFLGLGAAMLAAAVAYFAVNGWPL